MQPEAQGFRAARRVTRRLGRMGGGSGLRPEADRPRGRIRQDANIREKAQADVYRDGAKGRAALSRGRCQRRRCGRPRRRAQRLFNVMH